MKVRRFLVLAFVAMLPSLVSANTWSSCQSIKAVSNYLAYSGSVYVILSPGIQGCVSDAPGAAVFRIGQMNVTADTMKSLLATLLMAYATDKRVMIYYDSSNSDCFSSIVSVGGYSGQCP